MALQLWLGLLSERRSRACIARIDHTASYGTHLKSGSRLLAKFQKEYLTKDTQDDTTSYIDDRTSGLAHNATK